jgi:hypothetical protein
MAEYRRSRVSHLLQADQPRKLFLVPDASPVQVQFAMVDRGASLKLVPGPAWVEQDGSDFGSLVWPTFGS